MEYENLAPFGTPLENQLQLNSSRLLEEFSAVDINLKVLFFDVERMLSVPQK